MASVAASIAVNLISNFIQDTLKLAVKGEESSPITEAIESTARYFDQIEGLKETLQQWLRDRRVTETLSAYILGRLGPEDVSVPALASVLVDETQFYLDHDLITTAAGVVEVFLAKIRAAYLARPEVSALHIANRQESRFDALHQEIQLLRTGIESAGGVKTVIQTHFDEATAKLEAEHFQDAQALFESLLIEIDRTTTRDRTLERRVHVNLANINLRFFEEQKAAKHFRAAATLDDDHERKSLHSAIASLVEHNYAEALEILGQSDTFVGGNFSYERSAARTRALLGLRRFEEAVEVALTVDATGKEVQRFELLGLVYRESNRVEDAERACREALTLRPSNPDLQYALASILLTPAIDFHNRSPLADLPFSLKAGIDEAANLLEKARARFREQGRRHPALEVDSNLAVIRALQCRFADVIQLLIPVTQSGICSAREWRTLGFAYLHMSEADNAVAAIKAAISIDSDPETEFMYAEALSFGGRHDEAFEFASKRIDSTNAQTSSRWLIVKASALSAKRQFAKAREVIDQALIATPDDPHVLLCSAQLFDAIGHYPEALKTFEEALMGSTGIMEMRVRAAFGSFEARQQNYARATELWKPLARGDRPSQLLDDFVRVAYNSRKFTEITLLAKVMRDSGARASFIFADVAAAAYERLDELNDASYWLEYVGDLYGNRPEQIVRLSNIKLRLGKHDEAIELLRAARTTLKKAKDLIGFAQSFSILGAHREALELGYSATLLDTDADTQLAYVELFLAVPDAIGKSADEIATFQDILVKFKDRFPDSSRLQSFQIDPAAPLDALRETLTKASKHFENVTELYKRNKIPLPLYARFLGKDIYQVWLNVVSDPNLTLFASNGTEPEFQQSQDLLSEGNAFLVDPIALFTFAHLELLDKLICVGDIYIAQRAVDQLQELQARRRSTDRETGVMGMVDGELFLQSVTPEQAIRINSTLNAATEWVIRNAKIVGLTESLTKEDKDWAKIIGSPGLATAITARQRGFTLITDDKTFGDIAKQNYGVSFVNSQAVIKRLFATGSLSQDEYDRAVLGMFEAGYVLTHVNDAHLFSLMADEQFQLTPRVKSALRVFEPSAISVVPACWVIAGILARLYVTTMPHEMRDDLSLALLNTLAVNHPKAQIKTLVREFAEQRLSPKLFLQLGKIEQILDRW
jgi:tetratricopeptide (TPR) repeat protein